MSFPINVNIPAANNDPADDQPLIRQNFANTSNYLAIDHIAPGTIGDGFHKQVTYFTKNTPAAPTDPASITFTAQASTLSPTTASGTTIAQEFYRNQNGIFPSSCIRAFASFSVAGAGVVTVRNAFNIASITSNAGRTVFTINIVVGATNGTNFLFIPFFGLAFNTLNTVKTANTMTITVSPAVGAGFIMDFLILQV